MPLAQRKQIELTQKLRSLRCEFADWRKRSEDREQLAKHYTQIRRITMRLEGLLVKIETELQTAATNEETLLGKCRELELNILDLHRIWDFFRTKLLLRSLEAFHGYLSLADEFAWSCYEMAQRRVKAAHVPHEEIKEPPLVYFEGESSPSAIARHKPFLRELKSPEGSEATAAIKDLPIPLVGVPWFQITHLPDALLIAHEVGHLVEEDLKLTKGLNALLNQAMSDNQVPDDRQEAWQSWLGEVFADVYGTLAAGPSFTGALIDFLAREPKRIANQKATAIYWGLYPTDYLRILLSLQVLAVQGFSNEKDKLEREWTGTYQTHQMGDFEADLKVVAGALVLGPYPEFGGVALRDVIPFTKDQQKAANNDADLMLEKGDPENDDVRILFAGGRLAYEKNPVRCAEVDVVGRVQKRISNRTGIRGEQRRGNREELSRLDAYDLAEGAKLYLPLLDPPA